jgi:CBS domain-containing protein
MGRLLMPSVTVLIQSSVSMRMPSSATNAYRTYQTSPERAMRRSIMLIRDLYNPDARVTRPDEALADAAHAMLNNRVGSLIVIENRGTARKPIGILTDRDIVRGQLRLGADLFCLTVGEVMTADPLTITIGTGVTEAIEAMQARAVRRAPVVDGFGNLMGIITLDDLLPVVAGELEELSTLIGKQSAMVVRSSERRGPEFAPRPPTGA